MRRLLPGPDRGAIALVALLATGAAGPTPALPRLAVLPVDNATGHAAPLDDVGRALESAFRARGFEVAPDSEVADFLKRNRIRYTGGVGLETLRRLASELGVEAAVLTSVDLLVEESPPRFALTCRAVRASDGAIAWAGETSLAGEARPGILGTGEVSDAGVLIDRAVDVMSRSLREKAGRAAAAGSDLRPTWDHPEARDTFRPARIYRNDALDASRERPPVVAVLPFDTLTDLSRAGDTIAGLFAVHLAGREDLALLEPGDVREALIKNRIIQESGLSLAQAEALRVFLQADLFVTGQVLAYDDRGPGATPRVAFSVRVIDAERRTVLWSCLSAHEGDDGVNLFGTRRLRTARSLASEMVRSAAEAFAVAVGPGRE